MSLVDLGKRLLEAAKQGHTDEVRALMSNGAPFTTDWLGTSPLHFAALSGHADTAEVLLRAGISRDARTKVDRTPLHVASQEGHLDIVDLLVRNGADIEAKDMLKMTPLHWAVEKGHFPVIEILMRQGADVSCANKFDKTPVDIAITNGRPDIAEILQHHRQTIVEVTTDQQIVEEVTATETISSEVADNGMMEETMEAPVTLMQAKQEEGELIDEGGEQSNTAVLATLAALAEATGPLNADNATNTNASETLQWLETHGITMISGADNSTIVSSSLESGQNLILTEAGKMALNFVKHQGEEGEVDASDGQVIIVDPNQHATQSVSVSLAQDSVEEHLVEEEQVLQEVEEDEPDMKKIKLETGVPTDCIEAETITMTMMTKEEMVEEQVVLAEDLHTLGHEELVHEELVHEEQLIEEEEVDS